MTTDKRYSDYLTRQAFGDSNTPSGPSLHAPRSRSRKAPEPRASTKSSNWHRVISSCTRILKAPLILLASEPGALRTLSRAAAVWGAFIDVVICLPSLGLGKYEAAFRELLSAPIKARSSASSGTAPGLSDNFSTSSQSGGARGRE